MLGSSARFLCNLHEFQMTNCSQNDIYRDHVLPCESILPCSKFSFVIAITNQRILLSPWPPSRKGIVLWSFTFAECSDVQQVRKNPVRGGANLIEPFEFAVITKYIAKPFISCFVSDFLMVREPKARKRHILLKRCLLTKSQNVFFASCLRRVRIWVLVGS